MDHTFSTRASGVIADNSGVGTGISGIAVTCPVSIMKPMTEGFHLPMVLACGVMEWIGCALRGPCPERVNVTSLLPHLT
jgi:hypothetical protein